MTQPRHIHINQVDIQWDTDSGTFTFFGIPAALFWINPSLMTLLKPLADEIGTDLFRLQVAHSASQGTDEDYNQMVTSLGSHFVEGFLNWGKAVSTAGWGTFEVLSFDEVAKQAWVRVNSTWELLLQKELPDRWGCPFIQGKIIGIFSHAFKTPCWADEVAIAYEAAAPFVEFVVHASDTTIELEIQREREKRRQYREQLLAEEVACKTLELSDAKLKAEAAAFAKSKFMAAMSHELRAPLNVVIGNARLLTRSMVGTLDAKQQAQLQGVIDSAEQISTLVSQVLRYTEVSLDGLQSMKNKVSLPLLVDEVIDTVSPLIQRKLHQINNLTATEPGLLLQCNTGYLREMLLIFLTNAINFIPHGGVIEISAAKNVDGLRIEIRDNGPGVPESDRARIFEPFERVARPDGIAGTGIGLPLARQIAEILGASIGFEPNQPHGSVFWIQMNAGSLFDQVPQNVL